MKKIIICIHAFIAVLSFSAAIEANAQDELTIELLFPKKGAAPMSAPRLKQEAQTVSGSVNVGLNPVPGEIEEDRYLVEYFLDDKLLHQTSSSFSYIFDSREYENGLHKLVVNFWDKSGSSAIGMREIIIKNQGN